MPECDKCATMRVGKYPYYSYYSPKGVPTDVLWRYCEDCKNEMIRLFGIDESFFGKATDEVEQNENEDEYNKTSYEVRKVMRNMEK